MILEILGAAAIIMGVVFSALGVVGILRLPDTYSRLHASGKTSTLGVIFLCLGTGLIRPSTAFELVVLSIFVIFSGPVGSHAIAAAVHRGTAVRNQMLEDEGIAPHIISGIHRIPDEFRQDSSE